MGADMTLAVCRDIHFSKPAERWLAERPRDSEERGAWMEKVSQLHALIVNARIEALDPLPDNYEDLFYWHPLFYERADSDAEPTFTPDEVRGMIRDGVTRIFEYWRDTTTLHIEGKTYIATGGLSWGDPPTESYDPVVMVDAIGLFEKAVILGEIRAAWTQLHTESKEAA